MNKEKLIKSMKTKLYFLGKDLDKLKALEEDKEKWNTTK